MKCKVRDYSEIGKNICNISVHMGTGRNDSIKLKELIERGKSLREKIRNQES